MKPDLTSMLLLAFLAGLIVYLRTWIRASAERAAQHVFDARIEQVKSEFRRSEQELKARIERRETELIALRDSALSGRANRMAMLDRRRLDAVEKMWKAIGILSRMKMAAMSMSMLKLEALNERVGNDPNLRQVIEAMTGDIDLNKIGDELRIDYERPFLSPMSWAIYSAYSSIVLGSIMIMKVMASGLDNPLKLVTNEKTAMLIKTVLPHQADYIDKFGQTVYYHLLEEIEERLLKELRHVLEGADVDEASIRRAAQITQAARDAFPETQPAIVVAMQN